METGTTWKWNHYDSAHDHWLNVHSSYLFWGMLELYIQLYGLCLKLSLFKILDGCRWSSVVEYLLTMHKEPSSVPQKAEIRAGWRDGSGC